MLNIDSSFRMPSKISFLTSEWGKSSVKREIKAYFTYFQLKFFRKRTRILKIYSRIKAYMFWMNSAYNAIINLISTCCCQIMFLDWQATWWRPTSCTLQISSRGIAYLPVSDSRAHSTHTVELYSCGVLDVLSTDHELIPVGCKRP
jgi:hypothetical protein